MFRHASANLLKIFITSSYAPVTPFVIKNHGKSTNEDPPCLENALKKEKGGRESSAKSFNILGKRGGTAPDAPGSSANRHQKHRLRH
jgi:hypothetical protein